MFEQLIRSEPAPKEPRVAKPKPAPRAQQGPELPKVVTPWRLTPIQCRILAMQCEGLSIHEIAEQLCRSGKTLYTHLARAYEKMGALNPTHAVLMWDRWVRGQLLQLVQEQRNCTSADAAR